MAEILIISFVEWHGATQRPQHMACGFAAMGHHVTYMNPGYLHRRSRQPPPLASSTGGVRVVQPACLPGERTSTWVGAINNHLISRAVRGITNWDAIIFNDPRRANVALSLPARLRVFDAMDDLRSLMPSDSVAIATEAAALTAADRIWTGTAIMADRLAARHASVKFIPNGVDSERFGKPNPEMMEAVQRELTQIFAGTAESPRGHTAGFFGVLNERLDPDLIRALLAEGWRVVLIGPSTLQCPALPEHPQLARIGEKPYEDLPAWLACFDLAIIPYRTDGANRFLYPVKVLEYLAGEKPVLSSPLPDVQRFLSDYVLMETSPDGWRRIAREWELLRADAGFRAQMGRQFVKQRDWSAMIRDMADELGL